MSINEELAKLKNYIDIIDDTMKNLKSVLKNQGFDVQEEDGLQTLQMHVDRHKVGYFNFDKITSSDKFYLGISKVTTNEMGYKVVDKTSVANSNFHTPYIIHLDNNKGFIELYPTALKSTLSQYVFSYDDGSRSGTATVSVPNKTNVSVF